MSNPYNNQTSATEDQIPNQMIMPDGKKFISANKNIKDPILRTANPNRIIVAQSSQASIPTQGTLPTDYRRVDNFQYNNQAFLYDNQRDQFDAFFIVTYHNSWTVGEHRNTFQTNTVSPHPLNTEATRLCKIAVIPFHTLALSQEIQQDPNCGLILHIASHNSPLVIRTTTAILTPPKAPGKNPIDHYLAILQHSEDKYMLKPDIVLLSHRPLKGFSVNCYKDIAFFEGVDPPSQPYHPGYIPNAPAA